MHLILNVLIQYIACKKVRFYGTMHRARSAKRGIAIVNRSCVRLSVRPSVLNVDVYCGRMCRVSSKLITRIISSKPQFLQHRQSSPRRTPQNFGWNRDGVALLSRKPAISLKRGKIGLDQDNY